MTSAPTEPLTAERRDELMRVIRSDLRNLLTAQEAYFADNRTYADPVSALRYQPSEGLRLELVHSAPFGGAAVAVHPELDVICGVGVGAEALPWGIEGTPMCG